MPINFQAETDVISPEQVTRLWRATREYVKHDDDTVTVRFVDEEESRRLNGEYRKKDKATNVLTFSYESEQEGKEHDVAVCMPVAEREAQGRNLSLRDYVALLLAHAFLHAVGFDHERSAEEAAATQAAEGTILKRAGFNAIMLE